MSFFLGVPSVICLAFKALTTFFPVLASISFRVLPAIVPPCRAITLLSSNDFGFFSFEISEVVASASMFNSNSRLVMPACRNTVTSVCRHVVAEVFFFQTFKLLVFFSSFVAPRFGDDFVDTCILWCVVPSLLCWLIFLPILFGCHNFCRLIPFYCEIVCVPCD